MLFPTASPESAVSLKKKNAHCGVCGRHEGAMLYNSVNVEVFIRTGIKEAQPSPGHSGVDALERAPGPRPQTNDKLIEISVN